VPRRATLASVDTLYAGLTQADILETFPPGPERDLWLKWLAIQNRGGRRRRPVNSRARFVRYYLEFSCFCTRRDVMQSSTSRSSVCVALSGGVVSVTDCALQTFEVLPPVPPVAVELPSASSATAPASLVPTPDSPDGRHRPHRRRTRNRRDRLPGNGLLGRRAGQEDGDPNDTRPD
jgi:hypothetical protein